MIAVVPLMSFFCTLVMGCSGIYSLMAADGQSDGLAAPSPIPYAAQQVIEPGDSDAVIAEKAAKVLPRPNQTAWMRLERTFFIHFGPNTFRHVEWGSGQEDPSVYNPTSLDADQWIRAVKEGGGKMVILVCKHHDGFCLWPTRYTSHSVAASPWRGGKGDEVGDVARACQKYGVKMGVYLSPADLFQLRTNPKYPGGYYGNESEQVPSVIPTDPAGFKSDPAQGRPVPHGFKSFKYTVDDYNRYFLNQLYELLTQYGPIDDVWFDGANPDPSVHETYDYAAWYDLIRHLQPNAVISVKGPDVRWVGNESGIGRTTEWSVLPLSSPPDSFPWPDMHGENLGGRDKLVPGSTLWWYPAETNVPILYGWFWAPGKQVRTAADLVDIYYRSVGLNGNWLLNLSPDSRGLVPDDQLAPLSLAAQVIDETFAHDLAKGGTLTADSISPQNRPSSALDGSLDTWWEAAPGHATATLTLKLPKPVTFDVVSLQEAVDHRGQRIESFAVDVWDGTKWDTVDEKTTVGHRRLLRWDSPVTTDQVRIRIIGSRLAPTLAEIGLFKQADLVQAPVISQRDIHGSVTIVSRKGLTVVYTTDGSMPTPGSEVYRLPIPLPAGGTINAACVDEHGRLGMVSTALFSGYAPDGWKVVSVSGDDAGPIGAPGNAIDSDPSTLWLTRDTVQPHSIIVDMGHSVQAAGFSYLPRQDQSLIGVVDEYRFETSADGQNWTMVIDHGRFGNIKNNPVVQNVPFPPVAARFFRFTALKDVNGTNCTSAAEISVLAPGPQ